MNLSPDQKTRLVTLQDKQARAEALSPAEKAELAQYKNLIAHGRPVNSSHPGVANLTEEEFKLLKNLENRADGSLTRQEQE